MALYLDISDSIGQVTRPEYEHEREARLKGDELNESSKYKLRHLIQRTGIYAVDFLCEVRTIKVPDENPSYQISVGFFNKDGRPLNRQDFDLLLSLNGLMLAYDQFTQGRNIEAGYFTSALDEWDLGLTHITQMSDIEEQLTTPEAVPILA